MLRAGGYVAWGNLGSSSSDCGQGAGREETTRNDTMGGRRKREGNFLVIAYLSGPRDVACDIFVRVALGSSKGPDYASQTSMTIKLRENKARFIPGQPARFPLKDVMSRLPPPPAMCSESPAS